MNHPEQSPAPGRYIRLAVVALVVLFVGFSLPRAHQIAGQDEILHYVKLGDDLYRSGLGDGGNLIVFSPHLYGFAIWASHQVFGAGLPAARVPGLLAWLSGLLLAYLWGRSRVEKPAWPLTMLAIGCLMPLAVQGAQIVDIDNGFLVPLVFLQCWGLDLLCERRDWQSWLGLAVATALALWGRLTTPTILLPLLVAYAWARGRSRVALVASGAFLVGWLLFLATWGGYCAFTGVHFAGPFAYLRDSLFFTTVGSRGASLRKIAFTGAYLWLWVGGGVLLLVALVSLARLREWWADKVWQREDLFLAAGLYLLAGYSVVGGTLFGFPKYHCPAIPLLLAGCVPVLDRWRRGDATTVSRLVAIGILALLVQLLLIGDPLLILRLDLRQAMVSPDLAARPILLRLGVALVLGGLVATVPVLLAWRCRARVVPVLVAVALGMNAGLLVLQNASGYQTGYNYGDRGDAERVAEFLRANLKADSLAMVPGEVVYLLDRPGVAHVRNEQWRDAAGLVHALESPRMQAAGISIITNDASQYLTLTTNPEIRAILDRDYTEHDLGAYVVFLRNDPAPAPATP